MRHDGQKVLPKKTGMEPKAARLTSIPVETHFPVLGQRIMTVPIVLFCTAVSSKPEKIKEERTCDALCRSYPPIN
jgi:hypothetical protein